MTTLSVVIPAYNEADSIETVVQRVLAIRPALAAAGVDGLELIVVDDGSGDGTGRIVASCDGADLVCHEVNHGYGAALKTGFRRATGDLLAFLDADGTYPPESLPELCRVLLERKADLVIGSRMSGERSEMPLVRRVGNRLFAAILGWITRCRVNDSASGMRVFRRETLPQIYPLPDGLNFTPVMSCRALHEDLRVVEVAIPYEERLGRSKLSVIKDGQRFLQSILWTALSYNPVRILGWIGLVCMAFAGLVAAGLVVARLSGITHVGPWVAFILFAAMVLAVAGVSIFCLGATFNYLVSLFHRQTIRQGLFGRALLPAPLDRHFGWMGLLSVVAGVLVGAFCLVLIATGWDVGRLWLYLLFGADLTLIGVQLAISWVIMRVLDELSRREAGVAHDLGTEAAATPERIRRTADVARAEVAVEQPS